MVFVSDERLGARATADVVSQNGDPQRKHQCGLPSILPVPLGLPDGSSSDQDSIHA